MREQIKIVVSDTYITYDIPEKPVELIAFWQSFIDMIPEEYRSTGRMEVESEEDYGSSCINLIVSYCREETEEEESIRITKRANAVQNQRGRELAELARLRNKYEDGKH